jgi:hypothetical protein
MFIEMPDQTYMLQEPAATSQLNKLRKRVKKMRQELGVGLDQVRRDTLLEKRVGYLFDTQ